MSSCRSDLLPGFPKSVASKNKHFAQAGALVGLVVWLNVQNLSSFLRYVNHIRDIWQGKSVLEREGIPPEKLEQLRWVFWHGIGCLNSTVPSISLCFPRFQLSWWNVGSFEEVVAGTVLGQSGWLTGDHQSVGIVTLSSLPCCWGAWPLQTISIPEEPSNTANVSVNQRNVAAGGGRTVQAITQEQEVQVKIALQIRGGSETRRENSWGTDHLTFSYVLDTSGAVLVK